jgi:uncharacterized protein YdeI (YjbR/CyaY-like superfamily)
MTAPPAIRPRFFRTPDDLRRWFVRHHRSAREVWVAFYKKSSGKASITWPEAVDQALCFGWIDGIRKSIDEISYMNRLTPRTPRSNWSAVNIARAKTLIALGLMTPAGLEAFVRRSPDRSAVYSYEQRRSAALDAASERRFRANAKAWTHFRAQAPSYQRLAAYWVISARKEETRARRLEQLIARCAAGRRIGVMERESGESGRSGRSGKSGRS